MPRGNPLPRLAITIDPEVHEKLLAAAAQDHVGVSKWMTRAARAALQRRAGLAAIAEPEKEHGLFAKKNWSKRVNGSASSSGYLAPADRDQGLRV